MQNVSDDELKKRGCSDENIELMKIIHHENKNKISHAKTANTKKIPQMTITMMQRLYDGEPRRTTRVATVYQLLLSASTTTGLSLDDYTKSEIEKAKEFRDKYQGRSMFPIVIAREMDIPEGAAKRMQLYYKNYKEGLGV